MLPPANVAACFLKYGAMYAAVCSGLDATLARLYYLAALKAACNLAASSCETEVFKILPPIPFSSSRQCASIAASETVANSAIQGFIQALDVFVNTPRSDVVR